ncbi:MAG: fructosamine kinase family protein [Bacteroidales bacterium]
MSTANIYHLFTTWQGEAPISVKSINGGCIGASSIAEMSDGKRYFVKCYDKPDMLIAEATGLKILHDTGKVRVPNTEYLCAEGLVLEYISEGLSGNQQELGAMIARMHKIEASQFGLSSNNFIGSTPQINTPTSSWSEFYMQNRLYFQFELILKKGYSELADYQDKILMAAPRILDTDDATPSLLHGDLWGGNVLYGKNGIPYLIDPAVYYGHREADIAMMRLFGGFSNKCIEAYNEVYPLAQGWEYRQPIYQLYHILNHLNLFGRGYLSQVKRLCEFYF